jgi:hypothetical protein
MEHKQDPSSTRPIKLPPRSVRFRGKETTMRALGSGAFKAGAAGTLAMALLMLISLVDVPLLPCLVIPGFILILVANGILAGLLTNERLNSPRLALRAGLLAGLVTGLGAAFVAVLLAAFGLMFTNLGEGVRAQFTSGQLQNLAEMGISPQTVRIAGAVFFALLVWGVFGTVVAAALGMLGAHLYYRLR